MGATFIACKSKEASLPHY